MFGRFEGEESCGEQKNREHTSLCVVTKGSDRSDPRAAKLSQSRVLALPVVADVAWMDFQEMVVLIGGGLPQISVNVVARAAAASSHV